MVTEQGAAWPPDEGPHFEHSPATAAQALDPAAFERAWSAGRAFAVDQAVSCAFGST
jgi:hypothetical protein